jgi:hypothetical protein
VAFTAAVAALRDALKASAMTPDIPAGGGPVRDYISPVSSLQPGKTFKGRGMDCQRSAQVAAVAPDPRYPSADQVLAVTLSAGICVLAGSEHVFCRQPVRRMDRSFGIIGCRCSRIAAPSSGQEPAEEH